MLLKIDNLEISISKIPGNPVNVDNHLHPYLAAYCNISPDNIAEYTILNKSIDARRNIPALVYSVVFKLKPESSVTPLRASELSESELEQTLNAQITLPVAPTGLKHPIIAGTGPAGLMAAYILALAGCEPVILDRGFDVDLRKQDIDKFEYSRKLNPESNYLIGEGGAGTFSDGKLYTRTRDQHIRFILKTFTDNGAPKEILYLKRPHIGSDILPAMIKNIRKKIEDLGGKFIFGQAVKDIIIHDGNCTGVILADDSRLEAPAIILAHGLGGRELTGQLMQRGVDHQLKGFQLGCRIEHRQDFIDSNQYHLKKRPAFLGAAEYNLVSRPPANCETSGSSSFCMCPGGEIVFSSATERRLSTNGMSRFSRNGNFANSCLIVNQSPELFQSPTQAYRFLDELEQQAFELGGGDYTAPAQDAEAFVNQAAKLSKLESSYCFGLKSARIDQLLPNNTFEAISTALKYFDRTFKGFMKEGKIVGIETCISSPVRFIRNPETLASSLSRLYIAGEGAGYAGGIVSAAADGIKIAEKILNRKY